MRPQFHFTAERGWINDPHGITWHEGRYHVFYQHVPGSTVWAPGCHWGHAVGEDLLSLEHRPVALAPGDGDDGVWSGSLVQGDDGAARVFYTATIAPDPAMGRIRMATPDDGCWTGWTKRPGVLLEAPDDLDVVAYRDPFVLRDGDGWRMLVGAALRDGTAVALGYVSADLDSWSWSGVVAQRSTDDTQPVWTGALWECPQIFEIHGRHVLLVSVWAADVLHHVGYAVGTYSEGRFVAGPWAQLTFGESYYAPSFFRDAEGRPCLTFWMRGVQDEAEGWSGTHSVPHLLTLEGERLVAAPHPDVDRYLAPVVPPGTAVDGHAISVRWKPRAGDRLEVWDGDQQVLRVDAGDGLIVACSGGDPTPMPYTGGPVRILLDGPAAEISTSDGVLGAAVAVSGATRSISAAGAVPTVRPLVR